jgi:uncharacterized protein
MDDLFELRDPIHGFVHLNAWEREVVAHPVIQRLRRIRQLSWTDMVYPGAMHTRFEHSLGVMHVASMMFDRVRKHSESILKSDLGFDDAGLDRDRQILRLACLCHDVGHSPFSHAGEDLMPEDPATRKPYKHEHYSAAIVREYLRDVIDAHPRGENYEITATDIADLIEGSPNLRRRLLWRTILTGQIDADRSDYLLRDAYHIGVAYGNFDLLRLINTLKVAVDPKSGKFVVAVEEGGIHAAEALIMARYMMFTQVYFHKTRRAYDFHIVGAMRSIMQKRSSGQIFPDTTFLPPTCRANLDEYLKWDDWYVLGQLQSGEAGQDGKAICERKHHRLVFQTSESPSEAEVDRLKTLQIRLSEFDPLVDRATSTWYKFESADVPIINWDG